jgi:hypothetical protein
MFWLSAYTSHPWLVAVLGWSPSGTIAHFQHCRQPFSGKKNQNLLNPQLFAVLAPKGFDFSFDHGPEKNGLSRPQRLGKIQKKIRFF